MVGDKIWEWDPPFQPKPSPLLPSPKIWPQPPPYYDPWNLQKLQDYKKLLEDIKKLEDQIGCPCEPNKADHIKILQDRITELEKQNAAKLVEEMNKIVEKANPKCKCVECQCNKTDSK